MKSTCFGLFEDEWKGGAWQFFNPLNSCRVEAFGARNSRLGLCEKMTSSVRNPVNVLI